MSKKTLISIIAGSASDNEVYEKAEKVLKENNITYELKILSAHRDPEKLDEYLKSCESIVYIAIAGLSAAIDLGDAGYKVYLIEKNTTIGGRMSQLDRTFPTDDCSI